MLFPTYHKYRKSKKEFFIAQVERNVALSVSSGEELYDEVL
jgi:hypothetical protein